MLFFYFKAVDSAKVLYASVPPFTHRQGASVCLCQMMRGGSVPNKCLHAEALFRKSHTLVSLLHHSRLVSRSVGRRCRIHFQVHEFALRRAPLQERQAFGGRGITECEPQPFRTPLLFFFSCVAAFFFCTSAWKTDKSVAFLFSLPLWVHG